jgi:hypothetical protein
MHDILDAQIENGASTVHDIFDEQIENGAFNELQKQLFKYSALRALISKRTSHYKNFHPILNCSSMIVNFLWLALIGVGFIFFSNPFEKSQNTHVRIESLVDLLSSIYYSFVSFCLKIADQNEILYTKEFYEKQFPSKEVFTKYHPSLSINDFDSHSICWQNQFSIDYSNVFLASGKAHNLSIDVNSIVERLVSSDIRRYSCIVDSANESEFYDPSSKNALMNVLWNHQKFQILYKDYTKVLDFQEFCSLNQYEIQLPNVCLLLILNNTAANTKQCELSIKTTMYYLVGFELSVFLIFIPLIVVSFYVSYSDSIKIFQTLISVPEEVAKEASESLMFTPPRNIIYSGNLSSSSSQSFTFRLYTYSLILRICLFLSPLLILVDF